MHIRPDRPTEPQKKVLFRILERSEWPTIETLTMSDAWKLIHNHSLGWRDDKATDRQKVFLKSRGLWQEGMTKGEASDVIAWVTKQEKKE
jgi:hypothetical protein